MHERVFLTINFNFLSISLESLLIALPSAGQSVLSNLDNLDALPQVSASPIITTIV